MRRPVRLALAALLLASTAAIPRGVSAAGDELQPRIEIVNPRFDFGEVFEKAEFEHTFVVRNTGKADLVIEQVKPG